MGIQSTLTCLCLALRCISRQGGRTLDWARNMKIYGRARLQDEDEEDVPMMHIFHGSGHQPISSLRWMGLQNFRCSYFIHFSNTIPNKPYKCANSPTCRFTRKNNSCNRPPSWQHFRFFLFTTSWPSRPQYVFVFTTASAKGKGGRRPNGISLNIGIDREMIFRHSRSEQSS